MSNFTKKLVLSTLAFCFCTLVAIGQQEKGKKKLRYDDWPITVAANGDIKSKISGDVTPNFVTRASWDHRILTYFFQNGTADMAGTTEWAAVRQGLALWEAQTKIRFLEVCNAANADIVILWGAGNHGDAFPFDGTDGVLAHCYFPPPVGNPLPGDMHFDEDETWVDAIRGNANQPIDLVTIAAHEIGHGLGLDHTNVSGQLMDQFYTQSHRYLGSDDIAGIQSLYGAPSNQFITGPDFVCSTSNFAVLDRPGSTTATWSSTNPSVLTINSSTGVATKVGNGTATINVVVSSGCGATISFSKTVFVGNPINTSITVDTDVCSGDSQVVIANLVGATTSSWAVTSGNSSNAYLTNYGNGQAYFNSYIPDCYGLQVSASNACGSISDGTTICVNSCFDGLKAYPNPAKDFVTLDFSGFTESSLPDEISIFGETSSVSKKNINIRSNLSQDKKVLISTQDLPRGTYFFHIISGKSDKKVVKIRVVLE